MTPTLAEPPLALARAQWEALEHAHAARADALTERWRTSRAAGQKHPIEDFLFTYYSYKPGQLRRWHPGAGVELMDAAAEPRANWRFAAPGRAPGSITLDEPALRGARGPEFAAIRAILRGTASRPASFGCFGMHEWAMTYRQEEHRHAVPLRLGQRGTDAVVEASEIRCTHFDAYRFFTPEAAPRNLVRPTRETQAAMEQPGCLHAGMDLYKWATKLGPLIPGALLLDAFELARDIRWMDMRASPYDVRAWGAAAVAIETPEGKAEYARAQRGFTERGQALRARLIAALDALDERGRGLVGGEHPVGAPAAKGADRTPVPA